MTRSTSRTTVAPPPAAPKAFRCAIYTRKSTEEGLEQEFNSLDAQRDAGENYIRSQQHEGWVCLPTMYDDGGFTGANMERPALQQLIADIEAGRVDCVVVYKVDRLSRSLLDFARIMEVFERKQVSFVSVTQSFNTANSMGRLVLNVLLSFAQFEREMISERTRDKIAAARRKGKWAGGRPLLGYDVVATKLVVNEPEAQRVREIFDLYIEKQSLMTVLRSLNGRGWRTKAWITNRGRPIGGKLFDKTVLRMLLTNVAYIGKIRYKTEVHTGEHQAIVPEETFVKAGALLKRNHRAGVKPDRNRHAFLLKGLMRCAACGCGMSHSYTVKTGKRYRYYDCENARKRGSRECPSPTLPAAEVERFVLAQLKQAVSDVAIVRDTLAEVRRQIAERVQRLQQERSDVRERLKVARIERTKAISAGVEPPRDAAIEAMVERLAAIDGELGRFAREDVQEADVAAALAEFDALWAFLALREQCRVVALLVAHVAYDGRAGKLAITLRDLAGETKATEGTA